MGVVACRKHGLNGFYEICVHVHKAFRKNIIPEMHRLKFSQTIFLCAGCYEKENMQRFEGIDLYDEISKQMAAGKEDDPALEALAEAYYTAYRNIERRVICVDCYSDVQLAYARNHKLPDPFTAYEYTMTHENARQIKAFKKYLLDHYDFADSIVDPQKGRKALFISSGNVAQPLTILVYYVTDIVEQEKILWLVNNFFTGKKRYQRKIIFREKEKWTPVENGFTRGEEPDIREVITR
jgi:hypothetical protein